MPAVRIQDMLAHRVELRTKILSNRFVLPLHPHRQLPLISRTYPGLTIFAISASTPSIFSFNSLTFSIALSAASFRFCITASLMDSSARALLSSLASFSSWPFRFTRKSSLSCHSFTSVVQSLRSCFFSPRVVVCSRMSRSTWARRAPSPLHQELHMPIAGVRNSGSSCLGAYFDSRSPWTLRPVSSAPSPCPPSTSPSSS